MDKVNIPMFGNPRFIVIDEVFNGPDTEYIARMLEYPSGIGKTNKKALLFLANELRLVAMEIEENAQNYV